MDIGPQQGTGIFAVVPFNPGDEIGDTGCIFG
jgi:hypothetical protein